MKNKILQEFLNSDIKIISQEKLEQYIEYCIYKNQKDRIKDEEGYSLSSHHHILPEALFNEYKDLRQNPWNGTHLLYSDHYYAHWLLTEAIDDYGQLFAFCAMHNKDLKIKRITESDLIPPEEFQKKMEERSKGMSEWYKNNPDKVEVKTIKHKNALNKEITLEDGSKSSVALEAGKKVSKKLNKKIILEDGTITTIALQRALKSEATRDKEIVLEDGTITTRRKQISSKKRENNRKIKDLFKIINGEGNIIKSKQLRSEIKEFSQGLLNTNKDDTLGKTPQVRSRMRNSGLGHLIGSYIELDVPGK